MHFNVFAIETIVVRNGWCGDWYNLRAIYINAMTRRIQAAIQSPTNSDFLFETANWIGFEFLVGTKYLLFKF